MDVFGESNIGLVRKRNEDRFLIRSLEDGTCLLAVADGMGGEAAGDVAAQILVDALSTMPFNPDVAKVALSRALSNASQQIQQKATLDPGLFGMGTTATAIVVSQDKLYYSHVGDSRLYHYRNGLLSRLTEDHTLLQSLISGGVVTASESRLHPLRHILEQCIGCDEVNVETGTLHLNAGDVLLLCSDGLTNEIDDREIEIILGLNESAATISKELIDRALASGARDNVTVVVAKV